MKSRTENSIKNSTIAFIGQIVILLAQFTTQTVFVRTLGSEYVGANGLFSNLLTFLSFADLGIGGAITFALYAPLANNDEKLISSIMNLFERAYHIIGSVILIGGIGLSFFIKGFINGNTNIPHLQFLFILFVLNSASSYFFAYLRSLLIANQQGYIDTLNRVVFTSAQTIVQIIFLMMTKEYIIFLIIQIFFTISANLVLYKKTKANFPFLDNYKKSKIPRDIIKNIKYNIFGAVASRFGIIVSNGTDNLILSKFIGLVSVGKYTSYLLLLNSIQNILTQVFNAVVASIANLSVNDTNNNEQEVFFQYQYLVLGVSYILGCTLLVIIQDFIKIWIGSRYLFTGITVTLLVLNWTLTISRISVQSFITAHGLYWETKWKSVCEALVNLSVGVGLIINTNFGVNSVIIGTLAANILISMWWEPLILFRNGLNINVKTYIRRVLVYLVLVACSFMIINHYNRYYTSSGFLFFCFTFRNCFCILYNRILNL
ncbi:hypothetical protein RIU76_11285 [Latilactobacillus sakei subsp. sakei]|uniref:lipopolysaccharide biosynthesis protein n=1 Tax=Latilactobacillus sakei TaxID=1599 RepID=UPI0028541CAB|nr:oligosaccharide flippase family protein [Latilactobacillus sakei]MDR7925267.1 hypothetical protein [Latilactobacillus sakei subsp. sakei]